MAIAGEGVRIQQIGEQETSQTMSYSRGGWCDRAKEDNGSPGSNGGRHNCCYHNITVCVCAWGGGGGG